MLSPFAGVGSEGYASIPLGRKFLGVELKPTYWSTAVKNLKSAERDMASPMLFDVLEEEEVAP